MYLRNHSTILVDFLQNITLFKLHIYVSILKISLPPLVGSACQLLANPHLPLSARICLSRTPLMADVICLASNFSDLKKYLGLGLNV